MTTPAETPRPKRKYVRRKPIATKAKPGTVGELLERAASPDASAAFTDPRAVDIERAPAPIERPSLRPEARPENSREEAERKAREWFAHIDSLPDGQDKYYIDPRKIPDGWTYEWKTHEVLGKQDPQYQVALAQTAWQTVPASRHPEMMPAGFRGATIDISGMRLMERPQLITAYQVAKDKRNAQAPINNIRAKLGAAPAGTFERGTHPGAPVTVKADFGPPIPVA